MRLQRPSYLVPAVLGGIALLAGSGCAGTYAREGARSGMVGGAVAGAVGSLLWGGNVVENVAGAAITSAAAGAAVGAMAEKPASRTQPPAPPAERSSGLESHADLVKRERALAERIGPQNFEAARLLARCDHEGAIQQARRASGAEHSEERRAYALMIEAVAAEEAGDAGTAAAVYPRLVQIDPARESVAQARNDALSGVLEVQKVRTEYDLPATCT